MGEVDSERYGENQEEKKMRYEVQVTRSSDQFVEVEADSEDEAKEKAIFEVQDHIGEQGEELWSDEEFVATIEEVHQEGK